MLRRRLRNFCFAFSAFSGHLDFFLKIIFAATELSWLVSALLALGLIVVFLLKKKANAGVGRQLSDRDSELRVLRGKLEENRFNLECIVSSMDEGLLIADRRHVIRLVNRSLRNMFQIPGDPVGQTVLETLREASVEQQLRDVIRTGQRQSADITVMQPGQRPRYLEVNAVPGREDDGVVMVFHDVTRIRELEEIRREFVANVSHELRTPLAIFQGYVETLIDNPEMEQSERADIYETLERHSKRLNAIVEDLLMLARIDSGRDVLNRVTLNPSAVVETLIADWQPRAREAGITLRSEVESDLPSLVADELRLGQVLNNLVDNALKYSHRGGSVLISVRRKGDAVMLSVQDNGPGISRQDLPRIFDRFYRVDKGRGRDAGGTGLGLSIVKNIATLHGGEVFAESMPGEGTTIRVCIPPPQLARDSI